jgi:STE24 endopeptidase
MFDPATATQAYIDSLGQAALAKAAAYTHGKEWLLFWDIIVSALVTWAFVRFGLLDKLEAKISKRGANVKSWLLGTVFIIISAFITLPWTIYEDWWRQTSYGRTSQPFADWLSQQALGLCITVLSLGLLILGIYALIRKARKTWWLWATGLCAAAMAFAMFISPVVIEPLFNTYKPLPEGQVKSAIVAMAQEAHIPADRIFMYDGSRQSNNFTANAGGIGPYARIAISDVAYKGASLEEVKAVTGHEIGHYVLGHSWSGFAVFTLLTLTIFFLMDRHYTRFARLFGSPADIANPLSLPVLNFMMGLALFVATPLTNTLSRMDEQAADDYSYAHVNLPDAMASALVKTAEYRNPRPHALEEIIFYDHPSVERRVRVAMEWKAAHSLK